jgi:hypothetical protein
MHEKNFTFVVDDDASIYLHMTWLIALERGRHLGNFIGTFVEAFIGTVTGTISGKIFTIICKIFKAIVHGWWQSGLII